MGDSVLTREGCIRLLATGAKIFVRVRRRDISTHTRHFVGGQLISAKDTKNAEFRPLNHGGNPTVSERYENVHLWKSRTIEQSEGALDSDKLDQILNPKEANMGIMQPSAAELTSVYVVVDKGFRQFYLGRSQGFTKRLDLAFKFPESCNAGRARGHLMRSEKVQRMISEQGLTVMTMGEALEFIREVAAEDEQLLEKARQQQYEELHANHNGNGNGNGNGKAVHAGGNGDLPQGKLQSEVLASRLAALEPAAPSSAVASAVAATPTVEEAIRRFLQKREATQAAVLMYMDAKKEEEQAQAVMIEAIVKAHKEEESLVKV